MKFIWKVKENKSCKFFNGISPLLAQILCNRGFDTLSAANLYLNGNRYDFYDPFIMKNMSRAVDRILEAINKHQKILIYGDYDVDGVSSTVIISKVLSFFGVEHIFYHPNRVNDGYGFHPAGVEIAKKNGCALIITVDVGIGAIETVEAAKRIGIDVIITDHHKISGPIPKAMAVIDPQQEDCHYPFKGLAGAGVSFKLAEALLIATDFKINKIDFDNLIAIAALGTVVDVAELKDENRIITRLGLEAINDKVNIGLKVLSWVANIKKPITAGHLGFQIGPRLNVAGRLGEAALATKLLLSNSEIDCLKIAVYLSKENQKRKSIQEEMTKAAINEIESNSIHQGPFLVISGEGWHKGIIGLVASDLQEEFYKPTIVIATKNGKGHGSARSIPEFHMFNALQDHSSFFLGFGGHKQAAGLSMNVEKIDLFRQKINEYTAERSSKADLMPKLNIDLVLCNLGDLTISTVEELSLMEPFGLGNPAPLFMIKNAQIRSFPEIVGKNHLKFQINDSAGHIFSCIGWKMGEWIVEICKGQLLNVVFKPTINEFNGNKMVQLEVKDF